MADAIRLAGLSGSLRTGSHNTSLLQTAAGLLPPGAAFVLCDISDFPLFNQDLEAAGVPAPAHRVREQIRTADAVLIATPEYNFSVPGVLKNALDWISRPATDPVTHGKPVAIIGAGGRLGTARAQYHLREICLGLNMVAITRPEVFVMRSWEHIDAEGRLTDREITKSIEELLAALISKV